MLMSREEYLKDLPRFYTPKIKFPLRKGHRIYNLMTPTTTGTTYQLW